MASSVRHFAEKDSARHRIAIRNITNLTRQASGSYHTRDEDPSTVYESEHLVEFGSNLDVRSIDSSPTVWYLCTYLSTRVATIEVYRRTLCGL